MDEYDLMPADVFGEIIRPAPPVTTAPAWAPTKTKAQVLATIPDGAQLAEQDMRSMAASALLFAQKGNVDVPPTSALREFNAPTTANSGAIATYRAYWGI